MSANPRGRRIPIDVSNHDPVEYQAAAERAFATICPICQRRYGSHDGEEMRICFPTLVMFVPECERCQKRHDPDEACP